MKPLNRSILLFFLLLSTSAWLFAGGSQEKPANHGEQASLNVWVSILPQSYFVERIAGDHAKVSVLVPPGRSPATYEPNPKQVTELGGADIFFTIGVPFENSFLPSIKGNLPHLRIVETAAGIKRRAIQSEVIDLAHNGGEEHGDEEDAHDHESGLPDPHIWLSPPLVKIQARNMLDALIALAPHLEGEFRKNFESFVEDLDALDRDLQKILEPVKGSPLLVYHPSFAYFADHYGLTQIPIELGGNEPSPRELQEIISLARAKNVRVLFVQPEFSKTSARRVAEAIGGVVVEVAPLRPDYLDNMRSIAEAIKKGLAGE
jgi:zinc transport system substrate-binding protein